MPKTRNVGPLGFFGSPVCCKLFGKIEEGTFWSYLKVFFVMKAHSPEKKMKGGPSVSSGFVNVRKSFCLK